MNIAVYGRTLNRKIVDFSVHLIETLRKHKLDVTIHKPFMEFLNKNSKKEISGNVFETHADLDGKVDFLFSIGGDGTLLDTIALIRNSGIPILGINTGRFGFLSSIAGENFEHAIQSIIQGHYTLDHRPLLRLESNKELFRDVSYALNEVTLHRRDSSSMITINTYLNGEFLNSYWADGLIISTPTGSTGYSLSCGGPIVVPQSESLVITPISPHNLNVRPIIVSDKNIISLEVEGRSKNYLVTLDNRSVTIDSTVKLAIKKEEFTIKLVRLYNENFLSTLRNKLMWGVDTRN